MSHPVASHVLHVAPSKGAYRVGLRAGISVLVPLLLLVLTGHLGWAAYAAFGAFTSLYGRRSGRAERAGMQGMAAVALVLAVTLGVLVSLVPGHLVWMVVGGALVAAGGSLLSDALAWHPPGPIFLLFGFCVCALIPGQSLATVPLACGIAAGSALFAIFVGWVGALRDHVYFTTPTIRRPTFRQALQTPDAGSHLLRYLLACLVAGSLGLWLGGAHPYWSMVAVCAGLAGPTRDHRLARSINRTLGTLAGLVVAAALLIWQPSELALILMVAVLQFLAELLIGVNYGIALLAVTPLALIMGELGQHQPLGQLLADRAIETIIGSVVAIAVLLLIPDRRT